MTNVVDFAARRLEKMTGSDHSAGTGGTGNGGGDDMEARVKRLEDDMLELKTDVKIIKATVATRDDLHAQTNKFIGWLLGGVGVTALIAGIVASLASMILKAH